MLGNYFLHFFQFEFDVISFHGLLGKITYRKTYTILCTWYHQPVIKMNIESKSPKSICNADCDWYNYDLAPLEARFRVFYRLQWLMMKFCRWNRQNTLILFVIAIMCLEEHFLLIPKLLFIEILQFSPFEHKICKYQILSLPFGDIVDTINIKVMMYWELVSSIVFVQRGTGTPNRAL